MGMRHAKGKRAIVPLLAILLIILVLLIGLGIESYLSQTGTPNNQGQPTKNPVTGLYTVYVVVDGHRDYTIFHTNLHANIHIDLIFYYFTFPPNQPTGQSILGFSKPIHSTVTVTGSSIPAALVNTFDMRVAVGAKWGTALTYTLPSGTYTIEV